jgi:hypothetical protein
MLVIKLADSAGLCVAAVPPPPPPQPTRKQRIKRDTKALVILEK